MKKLTVELGVIVGISLLGFSSSSESVAQKTNED